MDFKALERINCRHEHFAVYGSNQIGCGTCLNCGKEICLDYLFTHLHDRMQKKLAQMEEVLTLFHNEHRS